MPDFLPGREADFVTWTNNFSTKISASPTSVGLSAGQATAYAALNTAFITAYTVANDPMTRSPANIITKDTAMDLLKVQARVLAAVVQSFPAITDTQRADLGLTVPAADPAPIPPPAVAPGTHIISAVGRIVKVRIHDSASSTKRGKPAGCVAAYVYSFVGATYPTDPSGWEFQGSTTKSVFEILFPDSVVPGTKVWVCAVWVNPRLQTGPISAPIGTNLPGGLSMAG